MSLSDPRCANCGHWEAIGPDRKWTSKWGGPRFGTCTGRTTGEPLHDLTNSRTHGNFHCNNWITNTDDHHDHDNTTRVSS